MKDKINACLKKLRTGNPKYFDEFYELTKSAVFFTIIKILKNDDDTADAMQEVYVSFMSRLEDIDEENNAYAYLLTSARNKALNMLRQKNRTTPLEREDQLTDGNDEPWTEMPLLSRAKKILTEKEWQLLELCVVYGYKRVEAAKMLNCPISTINWQYNNVLKKLGKIYKEVYDV